MNERPIDKRQRLNAEVFTYRITKDGKVFLSWHGKQIKVLKGEAARDFSEEIASLDHFEAQLLMARLTGNFKHGNERH